MDTCDAQTTVMAMIEDPQALDHVDEIAAVEGLDGLFIGRGDLTVAYRAPSPDSNIVRSAVRRICAAGREGIASSDQGFLSRAGADVLSEFDALTQRKSPR